jgi:NADH-quinone oxidoreductase subunit J
MSLELYLINIFGILMIILSFMVVMLKNLVHSVIALVMVFFNAAAICFIYGFEYMGLILTIIYIGAIAVLFLFIVLMINIREGKDRFIELGGIIVGVILLGYYMKIEFERGVNLVNWVEYINFVRDIEVIGII